MLTPINLFDTGTQARAVQVSPARLINLYPVTHFGSSNPKAKALYKTWGTDLFTTLPNQAKCRGWLEDKDVLYVVCGNKFYAVGTSGSSTVLGTLSTSSGRVSIITSGLQIMIADGINGYVYTLSTGAFTTIADGDFIPSDYITYQSFRAIYSAPNTNKFYISDLNDFTSYSALAFASAESVSQNLVCAFATPSDLFLFGQKNTEVWYNTGDSTFPFEKNPNVTISYGCAAKFSIAQVSGSTVIWLSRNAQGQALLMRMEGYNPQLAVDENGIAELASLDTISDAYAACFQINGHVFYAITFPTENKSYLLDVMTGKFIRWASWQQTGITSAGTAVYELGRHLFDGYVFFNNKHIIADYRGHGRILELSPDIYTDYSCGPDNSIYCEVTTPVITVDRKRIKLDSLEIDLEKGRSTTTETDTEQPLISVSVSKDSGRTFDYTRIVNSGNVGNYKSRVKINKWGEFRDGAVRLFTNHSAFTAIFNVIANLRLQDAPLEGK